MLAAQKDNRGAVYYIGSILSILVILFFGKLVPTWGSVTEVGVCCLGVFLGLIIAVIFTGEVLWPTMVAMASLTLGGYFGSYGAAISGVFGHSLVYNFFLITALITAMNDIGTGRSIACILLTRKFFQKKPVLLSFAFLMAFCLSVLFMNTIGALLLAFPLFDIILDYVGIDKKDKYAKFMNVGLFIAINVGYTLRGAIMPDFLVRIGFFNSALEGTGLTVDLGMYTIFGFAAVTAFFAAYVLAMKYVFKCNFGMLSNTDFREISYIKDNAKLNRYQIIFLCGFLVFALFGLLPKSWASANVIGQYGALGLVCMTLSFFKRTDENGEKVKLFDFASYLKTVNWNIAMSMGIFSVIGTAISADVCGIKEWLISAVSGLLANNGSFTLALICIAGVAIITQVFNNNATATIFASLAAPIAVPFITSGQLNPALLLPCIAICSQSGFMTMAASGSAPILHAREGIDNKFIWTCGLFMELLFIVVTIGMYLLFSLI